MSKKPWLIPTMGNIYKLSLRDWLGERERERARKEGRNQMNCARNKRMKNREINWPFILCKRVQKY